MAELGLRSAGLQSLPVSLPTWPHGGEQKSGHLNSCQGLVQSHLLEDNKWAGFEVAQVTLSPMIAKSRYGMSGVHS